MRSVLQAAAPPGYGKQGCEVALLVGNPRSSPSIPSPCFVRAGCGTRSFARSLHVPTILIPSSAHVKRLSLATSSSSTSSCIIGVVAGVTLTLNIQLQQVHVHKYSVLRPQVIIVNDVISSSRNVACETDDVQLCALKGGTRGTYG